MPEPTDLTPADASSLVPGTRPSIRDRVPSIATYSILPDSLGALARALAGEIAFPGRVPVAVGPR